MAIVKSKGKCILTAIRRGMPIGAISQKDLYRRVVSFCRSKM
jgi:hypothetical protein